jgi:hypothetical protein
MAATGTVVALGIPLGLPVLRRQAAGLTEGDAGGFATGTIDPLVWFEIYPDNRVLVYVPKAEMGQAARPGRAADRADCSGNWERVLQSDRCALAPSADVAGASVGGFVAF